MKDKAATKARRFKSRASKVLCDGREELHGADMTARRREVFERDGYRCQMPVVRLEISENHIGPEIRICKRPVTWESGELAHWPVPRWKGRDDRAAAVICACKPCHRRDHNREPRFRWLKTSEVA